MNEINCHSKSQSYGSKALDKIVERLKSTSDARRRYEYVLWLAKKLPTLEKKFHIDSSKVKGCISEVYVRGEMVKGKLIWQGYSDALITKGLLSLLIEGLNDLTPKEVISIDEGFIEGTGLSASLTPSRANGFLNILLKMKSQAQEISLTNACSN